MQRIRGCVVSSPTDTLRTQFLNLKFSGHSRNGDRKNKPEEHRVWSVAQKCQPGHIHEVLSKWLLKKDLGSDNTNGQANMEEERELWVSQS